MRENSLAIIIVNYNSREETEGLLGNLERIGLNVPVAVVDNQSTDDSFPILYEKYHGRNAVHVLQSGRNGGYSAGNNFGIKYIENRYPELQYAAVLNPDVRLPSLGVMERLAEALDGDPLLAGATALTVYNGVLDEPNTCASALRSPAEMIFSDLWPFRGLADRKYPGLTCCEDRVVYVDKIQGCFCVLKLDRLRQLGYFDERVFLYFEEDILACKIRDRGWKLGVVTAERIYHNHRKKDREMEDLISRKFYNHCFLESKRLFMTEYLKAPKWLWLCSYIPDVCSRRVKDLWCYIRGGLK